MSTYNRFIRVSINDLYAERFKKSGTALPEDEAVRHKRKAEPANVALPNTRRWAASLPGHIHTVALMRTYPRIANLLAAAWSDPTATYAYMDELMVDRRGNRQGFPADVRAELVSLQSYHAGLRRANPTSGGSLNKRA